MTRGAPSPFFDSATLERQWRELEAFFGAQVERCSFASQEANGNDDDQEGEDGKAPLRDRRALVVCYNGDTARVATSVLRAKGVEAESIKGGAAAVAEWWPKEVQKHQKQAASAAAGCFEKDQAAVEVVRVLTA